MQSDVKPKECKGLNSNSSIPRPFVFEKIARWGGGDGLEVHGPAINMRASDPTSKDLDAGAQHAKPKNECFDDLARAICDLGGDYHPHGAVEKRRIRFHRCEFGLVNKPFLTQPSENSMN
jgi:hypothetical protein